MVFHIKFWIVTSEMIYFKIKYTVSIYVSLLQIMHNTDIVIIKGDFNDRYSNISTLVASSMQDTVINFEESG